MQTDFARIQQATDAVFRRYDQLREQGFSRPDSIDFVRLEYGLQRGKLVALLNDWAAGLHGNSGETTSGVISTPSIGQAA